MAVFVKQYSVRPKKSELLRAFSCAAGRLFHVLLIYFIQRKSEINRNL